MNQRLSKRLAAEAVGTAMLLATVVSSGIMGERLAAGNLVLTLLANSIATGAVLCSLILIFIPISGAHFNPAVTLASAFRKEVAWADVPYYLGAQFLGAFTGVAIAHVMFSQALFSTSIRVRQGAAQVFAEFIATFGLLAVVLGCARFRPSVVAFAVGAYITGASWFAASTSFANPAVTLARGFTDTFAGIRPVDTPAFILAQLGGAAVATVFLKWLDSRNSSDNRP